MGQVKLEIYVRYFQWSYLQMAGAFMYLCTKQRDVLLNFDTGMFYHRLASLVFRCLDGTVYKC